MLHFAQLHLPTWYIYVYVWIENICIFMKNPYTCVTEILCIVSFKKPKYYFKHFSILNTFVDNMISCCPEQMCNSLRMSSFLTKQGGSIISRSIWLVHLPSFARAIWLPFERVCRFVTCLMFYFCFIYWCKVSLLSKRSEDWRHFVEFVCGAVLRFNFRLPVCRGTFQIFSNIYFDFTLTFTLTLFTANFIR